MSEVEEMTVAVAPETAVVLRRMAAEERYASVSELAGAMLDDWARFRENGYQDVESMREMVRESDESGPGIPADDVYAELYAIIDEYRVDKG